MSLYKFGYSSEQLQLREYQELQDMKKSQGKLAQITHSKFKKDFEHLSESQDKLKEEKILDQILDQQEIQIVL